MTVDDIASLLVDAGLGTITGSNKNIFGNFMPASPDNLIALYDSTGFEPIQTMTEIAVEVRNLQVLVRNLSDTQAETKARQVLTVLNRFRGTVNGIEYKGIFARHTPFPIGQDENSRRRWTTNYIVNRAWA